MCERVFSRLPRQIPDIPSVKADADHIESTKAVLAGVKERYEKKETDEFLKPIILSKEGRIKGAYSVSTFPLDHRLTCSIDDDTLFFFNYRSDRMREIVSVFGLEKKPMEVEVPKNLVRGLSVAVIMCS